MTGDQGTPGGHRTRGLIQRVIDETVTPDDRGHAAGCASCGPVLMRATKFDDELRRTAQGFVAEELPRGILDPDLSGAPHVFVRRPGPGLAGIAAAFAIMVVAMSLTLLPRGLGGPTDAPTGGTSGLVATPGVSGPAATPADTGLAMQVPALRNTWGIGGSLIQNDWRCSSGRPEASATPEDGVDHEGIVCTSSKSQVLTSSTLITGESVENQVVEVAISGELVVVTETAISELAETMSKAAFLSVDDKDRAPTIADWVMTRVPELKVQPSGDTSVGIFKDLRLTLQRHPDGSFFLRVQSQPRS